MISLHVKISFSWCHVARLRSRNGIISRLLESATSRHLGFVVGSTVSTSMSLSSPPPSAPLASVGFPGCQTSFFCFGGWLVVSVT